MITQCFKELPNMPVNLLAEHLITDNEIPHLIPDENTGIFPVQVLFLCSHPWSGN